MLRMGCPKLFCFTSTISQSCLEKRVGRHTFIHMYDMYLLSVADIEHGSVNLVQSFSDLSPAMVATR